MGLYPRRLLSQPPQPHKILAHKDSVATMADCNNLDAMGSGLEAEEWRCRRTQRYREKCHRELPLQASCGRYTRLDNTWSRQPNVCYIMTSSPICKRQFGLQGIGFWCMAHGQLFKDKIRRVKAKSIQGVWSIRSYFHPVLQGKKYRHGSQESHCLLMLWLLRR